MKTRVPSIPYIYSYSLVAKINSENTNCKLCKKTVQNALRYFLVGTHVIHVSDLRLLLPVFTSPVVCIRLDKARKRREVTSKSGTILSQNKVVIFSA